MIICEREQSFIMVTQHEHAKVSGKIAQNWKDDYFYGIERKDEVVLGIYEHDRGWIEADAAPIWNDKQHKPYSFIDFPVASKVTYYKKGIDEVEKMNKYASLLCSSHYVSFLQNDVNPSGRQFLMDEIKRQQHLLKELGIGGKKDDTEKIFIYHLNILKFCDNLSLYICLNQPGEKKVNEHPFYRNGFPQAFPFANGNPIHGHWTDQENVSLSVFPLEKELQFLLQLKDVKKEDILENGILKAYKDTPNSIRKVRFT
jgi:hypothetical protein